MIGISLPLTYIDTFAPALPRLYDLGVRRVELRHIEHSPSSLHAALALLHQSGFTAMLHTACVEPMQLLQNLKNAMAEAGDERFILTLDETWTGHTADIQTLTNGICELSLPLTPAISYSGEKNAAEILSVLESCAPSDVGICLDLAAAKANGIAFPAIDKQIQKKLVGVRVTDTAVPVDESVRQILSEVSFGYLGTYNVSLSLNPKTSLDQATESLIGSITELQGLLPFCARLYDDILLHFDERVHHALTVWDQPKQGTYFSLIHSTSFLFQTHGYRWAMDIAFRNTYYLAKTPRQAAELFKDLELMIITHGHTDHFEERTIRKLAQNPTLWIIPEFLAEQALSWGLPQERMLIARAGETITVGPLTLIPFEGRHFRPVTGKGVPALGYYISAQDAPSLVFPADTRDFALKNMPEIPEADYCFANVWLGDKSGFVADYGDLLTDYSRYMLHYSSRNVLFAHLYECNRKPEDMWRRAHARLISNEMHRICPKVQTFIPASGDVMHLA